MKNLCVCLSLFIVTSFFFSCGKEVIEKTSSLSSNQRMEVTDEEEQSDNCTVSTPILPANLFGLVYQVEYYSSYIDYDGLRVDQPVVLGYVETRGFFPKRNNSIWVKIPFWYFTDQNLTACFKIDKVGDNGVVNVEGSYLGEITDKKVLAGITPLSFQLWDYISFQASATERRTKIVSTTGSIKLISGFNVELIQVGTEIEQGFTVKSVYAEQGTYSYNGEIKVMKGIAYPGEDRYPRFQITAKGYNYGLQMN
ncbi:hypothetical protein [Filimonas effusa]|uniref:Lipoprotein n=1 Tax=Filimonas effusa TaxID=2508721 RepID=A0A4Q1DCC4_9BACT|nr:hypothetical protein [Filimonas effusa]RXK87141.1 hypothetical protein ESB13_10285 [Filimonas effusa]